MSRLNDNQKRVLFNLLEANNLSKKSGLGWRSAKFQTTITSESGMRDLLQALVEKGLVTGTTNWWVITSEGISVAEKMINMQKTLEEQTQTMF